MVAAGIQTFLTAMLASAVYAVPPCPKIHTWHNVTAFRGTWKAQLSSISETARFFWPNCSQMEGPTPTFEIVGGKQVASDSATFGFEIGPGDTFDVAYSLTLVRTSAEPLHPHEPKRAIPFQPAVDRRLFASMACTYVIAAAGPAQPDVRAEPFNGATCMWERHEGVGENYQVDFSPPGVESDVLV
eukprot:TRINITY_DN22571_c1_g1_i1.p1 TRINITY_DN22571_c1_g1~~TRINITY_DN22571_c1_g1_i1.p1  ORF type:complete len:186 (+),score=13.37 TRINITY_DN22571_c1_g1_i1:75-632(+)